MLTKMAFHGGTSTYEGGIDLRCSVADWSSISKVLSSNRSLNLTRNPQRDEVFFLRHDCGMTFALAVGSSFQSLQSLSVQVFQSIQSFHDACADDHAVGESPCVQVFQPVQLFGACADDQAVGDDHDDDPECHDCECQDVSLEFSHKLIPLRAAIKAMRKNHTGQADSTQIALRTKKC